MKYAQYSGGFLLILTMCFNEGHTYKTYHIGNQKLYTTYQIPIHAYDLLYIAVYLNIQWRPTKVETTGATLNYETLISRLFETFLDFETKKQVVPRHAGTP